MGIAEEGLEAEGLVKPVMLGELGSIVEAMVLRIARGSLPS